MDNELNKPLDSDSMNLADLWKHLAKLTDNINNSNNMITYSEEYPLSLRKIQIKSIKALIKEIEKHHNILDK